MSKIRVDFITNQAPHYREALWLRLLDDSIIHPRFIFGTCENESIRAIDFTALPWVAMSWKCRRVRNLYFRSVLIWQRGVLTHVWSTDARALIILGDMQILSTWIAVWLARCRGISLLFWGHGLYGKEKRVKRWLRLKFLALADCNLVYGEHAKNLLVGCGFTADSVRAVYNSLDYERQLSIRSSVIQPDFYARQKWFRDPLAPTLLFVGRLMPNKRLDLLLETLELLRCQGQIYNLVLIGGGPDAARLRKLSRNLLDQIHFYGECYREEELGELIANADLCVAPGNVGLTAMHALGYGTPVCTHSDQTKQMPEAEAIIEGRTGTFFKYDDMNIGEAISRWFGSVPDRELIREFCYQEIDSKWNVDHQTGIIVQAVAHVLEAT